MLESLRTERNWKGRRHDPRADCKLYCLVCEAIRSGACNVILWRPWSLWGWCFSAGHQHGDFRLVSCSAPKGVSFLTLCSVGACTKGMGKIFRDLSSNLIFISSLQDQPLRLSVVCLTLLSSSLTHGFIKELFGAWHRFRIYFLKSIQVLIWLTVTMFIIFGVCWLVQHLLHYCFPWNFSRTLPVWSGIGSPWHTTVPGSFLCSDYVTTAIVLVVYFFVCVFM